jgi:hypothetical protein
MLLCDATDVVLEQELSTEILSVESLLTGAAWEIAETPSPPACEVALECSAWPRALRWAAVLRCLADAGGIDAGPVEFKLSVADDEAALDACRAASLLGWSFVGVVDLPPPVVAPVMSRWSERRPWCALRLMGANGHVLITDSKTLPARARFGRRFVDPDETAPAPATFEFAMGEETLQIAGSTDADLRGTHEYEICWYPNGSLALDLVVDGDWTPLPAVRFGAWSSAANREAAGIYGALSYWQSVLQAAQANVIEPLHRKED